MHAGEVPDKTQASPTGMQGGCKQAALRQRYSWSSVGEALSSAWLLLNDLLLCLQVHEAAASAMQTS